MVIWSLWVMCLPICDFPENGGCQLFSISGSYQFFSQICWVSPKLPRTILALWLVASLRPFDTCTEYMPCSQRTQPPRNRTPLLGLEPHALHMLGKPSTTELFFKFWDGISINCPCWLRIFHPSLSWNYKRLSHHTQLLKSFKTTFNWRAWVSWL